MSALRMHPDVYAAIAENAARDADPVTVAGLEVVTTRPALGLPVVIDPDLGVGEVRFVPDDDGPVMLGDQAMRELRRMAAPLAVSIR